MVSKLITATNLNLRSKAKILKEKGEIEASWSTFILISKLIRALTLNLRQKVKILKEKGEIEAYFFKILLHFTLC